MFVRIAYFIVLGGLMGSAHAELPRFSPDTEWQFEIANDSPNGFKFSDAYETHTMSLFTQRDQIIIGASALLVAPKRPKRAQDDWVANRAFGEMLTVEAHKRRPSDGTGDWFIGGRVALIGEFGIDKMQEDVHRLLGYSSMRNDLDNARMDDDATASLLITHQRRLENLLNVDSTLELGTWRNALSAKITKPTTCENFQWHYHAKLELVANDEIVSAAPVNADIRHIVPTLGVGFCTRWRNLEIQLSEEISLPRIRSDNDVYPMVRLKIGF